jgi:hypothetical protein
MFVILYHTAFWDAQNLFFLATAQFSATKIRNYY